MALNEVDGTQLSFIKEELEKLIKSNERITRKEIAEYFGILTRGCIMDDFFCLYCTDTKRFEIRLLRGVALGGANFDKKIVRKMRIPFSSLFYVLF